MQWLGGEGPKIIQLGWTGEAGKGARNGRRDSEAGRCGCTGHDAQRVKVTISARPSLNQGSQGCGKKL